MGVAGSYTMPSAGTLSLIITPSQTGILTGNVVVSVTPDNATDAVTVKVPVVTVSDVTAPTIEYTYTIAGNTATITMIIKDDNRIARNGIIFEGAEVVVFPTSTHILVKKVNIVSGVNNFNVMAIDEKGNVTSEVIVIEVTAPIVITIGKANPAIGLDVAAVAKNGRLMLPFRWFGEQILGATVDYVVAGSAEIVTLVKGDVTVELTLNSVIAKVNGVPVTLDVAAYATGGRTLVPARFLSEAFGYTINWNSVTDAVTISK